MWQYLAQKPQIRLHTNKKIVFFYKMKAGNLINFAKLVFVTTAVFCISLVSAGFYQFASQASQESNLFSLPKADGIVVLTGEKGRIHSAVNLLEARYGKRLLISGVSNKVSDKAVLKAHAPTTANTYCCIDLDRMALDTKGNAKYTAEWAKQYDFNRVIIVTSSYHMPRSLDHFRRAMPTVDLIPAQVIPSDLKGKSTLSMMASPKVILEYGKFLLTRIHLEPVAKYMWTSLDLHTNG